MIFVGLAACGQLAASGLDSAFGRVPTVNPDEAAALSKAAAAEKSSLESAYAMLAKSAEEKWAGSALYFNLANLCHRLGKYEEAENFYRKSLEGEPSFFMARKNLALTLEIMGKPKEAQPEFARALALAGGGDSEILMRLSSRRADEGDFSGALSLCNQALVYDPDNAGYKRVKAILLGKTGNLSESEFLTLKLLESDMKNPELWKLLGKVRALSGKHAQAIAAFRAFLAFGKEESGVLLALGDLYFAEGVFESAAEMYGKAIKLGVDVAGERAKRLSLAFVSISNYDAALKTCDAVPNVFRDSDYYMCKGIAENGIGKISDAESDFRKSISMAPDNARALFELGRLLSARGERIESEGLLRRAAANPNFERAAFAVMINSAISSGDYVSALSSARESLKRNPSADMERCAADLEKYLERAGDE